MSVASPVINQFIFFKSLKRQQMQFNFSQQSENSHLDPSNNNHINNLQRSSFLWTLFWQKRLFLLIPKYPIYFHLSNRPKKRKTDKKNGVRFFFSDDENEEWGRAGLWHMYLRTANKTVTDSRTQKHACVQK